MVCPNGTGKSKRHIWEPKFTDGFIAKQEGLEKAQWERKKCVLCELEVEMKFDEDMEEIRKSMAEEKDKSWSLEYG